MKMFKKYGRMVLILMLVVLIALMPCLNAYAFGITLGGVYVSGYALAGLCALCGVTISASTPSYVWQDMYNDISQFANDTTSALYQSASDIMTYCADYGAKVSSATGEMIEVSGIHLSNAITGMKNILNSHYLDATTSGVNLAYKYPGITYEYSQNVPYVSSSLDDDFADISLRKPVTPWGDFWGSVVGTASGTTANFKQLENHLVEFGYPFVEFAFSTATLLLTDFRTMWLNGDNIDFTAYGGRSVDLGTVTLSHQDSNSKWTTDDEITALLRWVFLPVVRTNATGLDYITSYGQISLDGGSTWVNSESYNEQNYYRGSLFSLIVIPALLTNSSHTARYLSGSSVSLVKGSDAEWYSYGSIGNYGNYAPNYYFELPVGSKTYDYYPISATGLNTLTVSGSGVRYPVDTSPDVFNPGATVGGNSISGQYNPDVADRTGAITGGADVIGLNVPVLDAQDVYNPSIDSLIGSGTLSSDVVIDGTTVATGTDVLTGIQTAVGDIATTTDTVLTDTATDVPTTPDTPETPTFPDVFPGLWDWVNNLVDNALQWFIFCGDVFGALPNAIKYTFLGGMTSVLAVGVIKKLLF